VILPMFITIGRANSALMKFSFSIVNLLCRSPEHTSDDDGIGDKAIWLHLFAEVASNCRPRGWVRVTQCSLRVKRGLLTVCHSLRVHPDEWTSAVSVGTSQMYHELAYPLAQWRGWAAILPGSVRGTPPVTARDARHHIMDAIPQSQFCRTRARPGWNYCTALDLNRSRAMVELSSR
jgi:hypothetical protein